MNVQSLPPFRVLLFLASLLAAALAARAQNVSPPPASATPAANGAAPAAATSGQSEQDDVVQMSPFQVDASSNDVGYYSTHSLAGTRMNSPLKDLAASISVVTRAQLDDTASVDINDVFQYESNTEGTHTYTEFTLDRYGSPNDRVQAAPATANRIRGIGSAAIARDYFVGLSNIPFDAYNVDRLTINRGPNSVLYGLGSPSGLVNSSPSQANIGPNNTRVELRVGSWDGRRGSINLNRTVIPDRLAVRFAAMYDDRGIRLQPAFDKTQREYAAVTIRPFDRTTIRASFENYRNRAQRANAVTPGDLITPWVQAGRPMWNPTTLTATYADGHTVTYAGNDFDGVVTNIPGLAPDEHLSRPFWVMENGQIVGPRLQRRLGNSANLNLAPTNNGGNGPEDIPGYFTGVTRVNQPERLFFSHHPQFERNLAFPGYITPGLTDLSIYDWEHLNLSAANFYKTEAGIYQVTVEQQVTKDFFLELGYHREEADSADENGINANQAKVYVDVNSHYLDGTPNPHAGKPFIESRQEVDSAQRPQDLKIYRATAAYTLDLSRNDNWSRWLGRHNIMGLYQRNETWNKFYRYRPGQTSFDNSWVDILSDGTYDQPLSGTNVQIQSNRRYYLGENGMVMHSSGPTPTAAFIPEAGAPRGPNWPTTEMRHFIWNGRTPTPGYPVSAGVPNGTWVNEPHDFAYLFHGGSSNQQRIDSFSGAIQSYFWDDRIVTTFGWRKDKLKSRSSSNEDPVTEEPIVPAVFDETTGHPLGDPLFKIRNPATLLQFPEPWEEVSGTTTSRGVVFHPFLHMDRVPTWLQGLSLHYNESDSFEPSSVNISLFGDVLENPTGTGKDYGISFSLFDNRLNARFNWYEATAFNSRAGGDTGTVVQRVERVENESNWGFIDFWEWNLELRDGLELGSLNFFDEDDVETQPYIDEIYRLSGLPPGTLRDQDHPRNDVRNIESEGLEISIDYNPIRNFNLKFTAARQETIEVGGAPYTAEWIEQRWPHWTEATNVDEFPMNPPVHWYSGTNPFTGVRANADPDYEPAEGEDDIRWTTGTVPSGWILGNVMAPFTLLTELNGKPRPQVREWRASLLATYRFVQGRLNGLMVGGSVRWEDDAAIGFEGDIDSTGKLNLDVNRPVFDEGTTYWDFWTSYTMRLFEDRVRMRIQLNLRNAFEDGGLRAIRANPNGAPSTFRIVEPRSWYLTTSFDF